MHGHMILCLLEVGLTIACIHCRIAYADDGAWSICHADMRPRTHNQGISVCNLLGNCDGTGAAPRTESRTQAHDSLFVVSDTQSLVAEPVLRRLSLSQFGSEGKPTCTVESWPRKPPSVYMHPTVSNCQALYRTGAAAPRGQFETRRATLEGRTHTKDDLSRRLYQEDFRRL